VTQYGYDNENNLTTITDANNPVTTMHYDALENSTDNVGPAMSL
jgi:YD repeat-containing protein